MRRYVALTTLVVVLASGVSFAGEKAKVPKEIVELLKYYVGNWTVEGTEGDKPLKGKGTFRLSPGEHCTLGTVSIRVGKEPMLFSLVTGWDSSTGWLTEQGSGHDGTVYRLVWRKVSATEDDGVLTGSVNGKECMEKNHLERKGEDEFAVVCTDRKVGKESLPDLTLVYHRVVKEKRKAKK